MGQGLRACNGNLSVLAQGFWEGKWSHVLKGPVIAPGGHCGTAPYSAGKGWCLCRKDSWGMLLERGTLSSEMNQKKV